MKRETLARRIAEKTNTPLLEDLLMGRADISALPADHILWPVKVPKGYRWTRDYWDPRARKKEPIIQIKYQGNRCYVHRLIFELITQPRFEYRMVRQCEAPTCVNPLHFEVQEVMAGEPVPDEVPDFEFRSPDEEWTPQEVAEVMETYLDENTPRSWSDIAEHPLTLDVPEDQAKEYLRSINKGHLT